MKYFLFLIGLIFLAFPQSAYAAILNEVTPNNKFGIHIINPVRSEAESAARLVNSSGGDWGYVTIVIQKNDRNHEKWQNFFNELTRLHLIPIVRIATLPVADYWERPAEQDAGEWASFLDSLTWPVKMRYVVIYNEPNHAKEWGNSVDPAHYAQVLNLTIDALKEKSVDFFVINGGLDQAAPHIAPAYYGEDKFLQEMEKAVPGIFNKLDGWSTHSYPNPGFSGSPEDKGRGSIRGYVWELDVLKGLGVEKDLPIFITETGWKHAEGVVYNKYLPDSETISNYFQTAIGEVWSDKSLIAVTPFILDYGFPPFDHFSFRRTDNKLAALGGSVKEFYDHYYTILSFPKVSGKPVLNEVEAVEPVLETVPGVKTESSFEQKLDKIWMWIGSNIFIPFGLRPQGDR